MPYAAKLAIVAALEREVSSFVKPWLVREREFNGREFRFFENDQAVLVCGGIGAEAAKRATEAVIALYQPESILSAGYAGALDRNLEVGGVVRPSRVIDANGETVAEISGMPSAILVSHSRIADTSQKAKLANSYGAVAVDMEAASVARVAHAASIAFGVVKVISDEYDAKLPEMDRFVTTNGEFRAVAFALHLAVRPWLWATVTQLAKNTASASTVLAQELSKTIAQIEATPRLSDPNCCPDKIENSAQLAHPMNVSQAMEVVHK
jgi:adenosylhomocysteine nucleosidase